MTGRGGAEGYLFTATRVLPAEGKVEARGKYKRRKVEQDGSNTPTGDVKVVKNEANAGNGAVEVKQETYVSSDAVSGTRTGVSAEREPDDVIMEPELDAWSEAPVKTEPVDQVYRCGV